MAVSAKFYVTKLEGQQVGLMPVCRGIENREWAQATPGGSMQMYISNPKALEYFKVGEEYTLLIEHSPKPTPGDGHEVEVIEQHYAGTPSKKYYICGKCGSYARLNEDGTPNWVAHEETFGKK